MVVVLNCACLGAAASCRVSARWRDDCHCRRVQVRAGEALFVPSGSLVSWHAVFKHTDGTESPLEHGVTIPAHLAVQLPVVLEHCFLDASNLNRVVSTLSTSSLVSDVDHDLLTLLQSPHLDISMPRRPEVGGCVRRPEGRV